MIIYLCLVAVAIVAGGVGFYAGRITAPECGRQHHETQIVIGHARLTKLDADGKPTGSSRPMPGQMTMTFQAEAVDPATVALLAGEEAAARVFHNSGRHHVVEADEEVTQVVPMAGPAWPSGKQED